MQIEQFQGLNKENTGIDATYRENNYSSEKESNFTMILGN